MKENSSIIRDSIMICIIGIITIVGFTWISVIEPAINKKYVFIKDASCIFAIIVGIILVAFGIYYGITNYKSGEDDEKQYLMALGTP
jgi:hypothetical protein